jgi:hypothetical protein
MPPDRGMELELETGGIPMPEKRLSDGELAELRTPLTDVLDRGWIQAHPALDRGARGGGGVRTHAGRRTARGASTPSRARRSNRSRTSTRCSTTHGGRASSASWI